MPLRRSQQIIIGSMSLLLILLLLISWSIVLAQLEPNSSSLEKAQALEGLKRSRRALEQIAGGKYIRQNEPQHFYEYLVKVPFPIQDKAEEYLEKINNRIAALEQSPVMAVENQDTTSSNIDYHQEETAREIKDYRAIKENGEKILIWLINISREVNSQLESEDKAILAKMTRGITSEVKNADYRLKSAERYLDYLIKSPPYSADNPLVLNFRNLENKSKSTGIWLEQDNSGVVYLFFKWSEFKKSNNPVTKVKIFDRSLSNANCQNIAAKLIHDEYGWGYIDIFCDNLKKPLQGAKVVPDSDHKNFEVVFKVIEGREVNSYGSLEDKVYINGIKTQLTLGDAQVIVDPSIKEIDTTQNMVKIRQPLKPAFTPAQQKNLYRALQKVNREDQRIQQQEEQSRTIFDRIRNAIFRN